VEDKGERAKLIFIGVSEKTFDEVGKSYGIQNKEDVYFLDCTISSTKEKCTEPVWEDAYTEQERNLCKALKNGPLMLGEAADAVGKDLYNFRTERLEKEGILIRADYCKRQHGNLKKLPDCLKKIIKIYVRSLD